MVKPAETEFFFSHKRLKKFFCPVILAISARTDEATGPTGVFSLRGLNSSSIEKNKTKATQISDQLLLLLLSGYCEQSEEFSRET
jgi:hypothetical protein